MTGWQALDSFLYPVPSGERPHPTKVRLQPAQVCVHSLHILLYAHKDPALNPSPDLLEHTLGTIESGLYADCAAVGIPTAYTSRLRCPRALSYTTASISVPRFSWLTAAAIRSAFIESIQLHNSLPHRLYATQNTYIHSYTVCTRWRTFTPPTTTPHPARRPTKTNSHLVGNPPRRLPPPSRAAGRLAKSPFFQDSCTRRSSSSWSLRMERGQCTTMWLGSACSCSQ